MAVFQILIDVNGNSKTLQVSPGDRVYWQATQVNGVYPEWYIIFPSPFIEAFIPTDPRSGQSALFTIRKTADEYKYLIASVYNPTLLQIEKAKESKRRPGITIGGGGIIIDQ
jgi:hypothetical protein